MCMRQSVVYCCLLLFLGGSVSAQAIDTLWTKYYGGTMYDSATSVEETDDGGLIITGAFQHETNHLFYIYLVKTDSAGDYEWSTTYGDTFGQTGNYVAEVSFGGYIIAGEKYTPDWLNNAYILRVDDIGDTLWSYTYEAGESGRALCVAETSDSGFIVSGGVFQSGNQFDLFMLKLDSLGDYEWDYKFDEGTYDFGHFVAETSDGSFLAAGFSNDYSDSAYNYYLVKTDADGNPLWRKRYGGLAHDACFEAAMVGDDGQILLVGHSDSWVGNEALAVRTDAGGDTLWTRVYSGASDVYINSVDVTDDGGFILGGTANIDGAARQMFFLKIEADGDSSWCKNVGGIDDEWGYSVRQLSDGNYVMVGRTESYGTTGDIYIVKLGEITTDVDDDNRPALPDRLTLEQNYPNPFNPSTGIDYMVPRRTSVRLTVYNILGQPMRTLVDEIKPAGRHSANWDGRDEDNRLCPSGIYLYCLETGKFRSARKMLLLK